MGMDVIGVNPKSEKGEYFRNNVWWWRPLSGYVQENHPHIAEHCEYWDSNDGDGLDEEKSVMLALALLDDIKEGKVAEYERSYNEWRASLPREACELCNCTGIRNDQIGVEHGMPERELAPEIQILTGRTHGYCNACQGVGTQESFMANYPFSEENVKEFAEFLMECGGFQIC